MSTHDVARTQDQAVAEPARERMSFRPACDIYQSDDDFKVVADMPGVTPDRLQIDLEGEHLSILGEREDFDYHRVFSVPEHIDADKISAELSAGVLRVTLPRHERTKPRRIEVSAS